jgi:hypothetical protein
MVHGFFETNNQEQKQMVAAADVSRADFPNGASGPVPRLASERR